MNTEMGESWRFPVNTGQPLDPADCALTRRNAGHGATCRNPHDPLEIRGKRAARRDRPRSACSLTTTAVEPRRPAPIRDRSSCLSALHRQPLDVPRHARYNRWMPGTVSIAFPGPDSSLDDYLPDSVKAFKEMLPPRQRLARVFLNGDILGDVEGKSTTGFRGPKWDTQCPSMCRCRLRSSKTRSKQRQEATYLCDEVSLRY